MLKAFAIILFTFSLAAEEYSERKLPKIEQTEELENEELIVEETDVSIAEDEDAKELVEILNENKPSLENSCSIEGIVEKDTAEMVFEKEVAEVAEDEIRPELEDLAEFVSKEPVTFAKASEKQLMGYDSLPISVEEKQKIAKILMTMAENNVFSLLFEKKHLERLGHDIRHVHPLRFLGTVFNDPRLVHCMHRIRRSSFKWDGFIDGFTERFREEIKSGNINAYIPGLAESLDVKAEDLQAYVNFGDFEGMVIFLLEKSRQ